MTTECSQARSVSFHCRWKGHTCYPCGSNPTLRKSLSVNIAKTANLDRLFGPLAVQLINSPTINKTTLQTCRINFCCRLFSFFKCSICW